VTESLAAYADKVTGRRQGRQDHLWADRIIVLAAVRHRRPSARPYPCGIVAIAMGHNRAPLWPKEKM
jgi:4'-phosphopantetheinyl transferase EntD